MVTLPRYGAVLEFRGASGFGARFYQETGEFHRVHQFMSGQLRWRKFSPIDRDWPIFELVDGDVIILDVTKGDDLSLEVAFHEGASGCILDLAMLERLLKEVKILLADETPA